MFLFAAYVFLPCEDYWFRKEEQFHCSRTASFWWKIPIRKTKLISEFGDQLPETDDFGVGYFIGKQPAKHWFVTNLASMYASLPKGKTSILLWCYGRSHHNCDTSEELGKSQKHKSSVDTNPPPPSKRKHLESDVNEISSELKDGHGTKYTSP